MSYNSEIFDAASAKIAEKRKKALDEAAAKRAKFVEKVPEYDTIEKDIGRDAIRVTRQVLGGSGDIEAALREIRDRNLANQKRLKTLLAENGLPEDYLEPVFECDKCSDTGFVDGKVCSCLKAALRKERFDRLNAVTPLELCTFESFTLDQYPPEADAHGISPRKLMERVYIKCKNYADNFASDSPGMLFQGGVGLGKTHLSLAIANEAINKGFGVVYGSVQGFMEKIENEHFGRASGENTMELCKQCDLLILDDLGVEFSTPFTTAALHDMIDTRLRSKKPTIISTNLNASEIEKRYTERLSSRIFGNFRRCQFVGKDVRIKLRIAKKEQ